MLVKNFRCKQSEITTPAGIHQWSRIPSIYFCEVSDIFSRMIQGRLCYWVLYVLTELNVFFLSYSYCHLSVGQEIISLTGPFIEWRIYHMLLNFS